MGIGAEKTASVPIKVIVSPYLLTLPNRLSGARAGQRNRQGALFVHIEMAFRGLLAALPGHGIHVKLAFVVDSRFNQFKGAAAALTLSTRYLSSGIQQSIEDKCLVTDPGFPPATYPHGIVCRKAVYFIMADFPNQEYPPGATAFLMQASEYRATVEKRDF